MTVCLGQGEQLDACGSTGMHLLVLSKKLHYEACTMALNLN